MFDNGNIRVVLPKQVAKEWIESDQTGIEASTGTLKVLIEKIFSVWIGSRRREKIRFLIHWVLADRFGFIR